MQKTIRGIPDGKGGAVFVWQDQRAGFGDDDIYAQHVLASGAVDPAWPADGLPVCGAAGAQTFPVITGDGGSGALVTWADQRAGASNSDVYAQHVLIGGSVDPGWTADGVAVCTATGSQSSPSIAGDGAHGAFIAWTDGRTGNPNSDVYAQHVLSGGTMDPAWAANGNGICTAASSQSFAKLVADGSGGALIVWQDFRSGTGFCDVYAQHVLADGSLATGWAANGNAVSTASRNQSAPLLLADGAGGAIALWSDGRHGPGTLYLYAQRFQGNGQLGGTVLGVPADPGASLALAVSPCPARGALRLALQLPGGEPAQLEILDVTGRRLWRTEVRGLGAGVRTLDLPGGQRLPPGVYLVRLEQRGRTRTARAVVLE